MNPDNEMPRGKSKKQARNVVDKESPTTEVVELGDNNTPTAFNEDTESNQCSTGKRPIGNRAAKDELKRMRMHKDALKMSAQAQKDMAAANTMRSLAYQNNSMLAMLGFPTNNMSLDMSKLWEDWEMPESVKLMEQVAQQNAISSMPTPQFLHVAPAGVLSPHVAPVAPVEPTPPAFEPPASAPMSVAWKLYSICRREKMKN